MRPQCATLLLSGILLCAAAPATSAGERYFELPDRLGALVLPVPSGWIEEPRSPAWKGPAAIAFRGRAGDRSRVLIVPLSRLEMNVAALVRAAARGIADLAVEREIEVRPLGGGANGYWFAYTDAMFAGTTPPQGEHRYTVQGAAAVGPVTVTFTVLTNDPNSRVVAQALEMMRGARYQTDT